MIEIVAKNYVKEEFIEEFKRISRELVEKSSREEGCISYHLYEELEPSNILTFIEIWRDMDCIEKHNASSHFTTLVPMLGKLMEKQGEMTMYKTVY